MNVNKLKISLNQFIDSFIFIYLVSIYVFSFSKELLTYNKIIVGILFISLLIWHIKNNFKFCKSKFYITFSSFIFICFLSIFWAISPEDSITMLITLMQLFFLSVFLFNYLKTMNKLHFFLKSIMYAGAFFAIYVISYYGFSNYIKGLLVGIRMGAEIANVNTIGVSTSIAAIIGGYYYIYEGFKKRYLAVVVMSSFVALGTGSRKVLLIIIIGAFLLYLLKINKKNTLKVILGIIALGLIIYNVLHLEYFSTILYRFEKLLNIFSGTETVDASTLARMKLIEIGIDQFIKTPFTGVGIGNTHFLAQNYLGHNYYLHNNYVELLASIGFFGTIAFYSMYLIPLGKMLKKVLKKHKVTIICFVIGLLQLMLQIGMVAYYSKFTYIYIILLFLASESKDNSKDTERK